MSEVLASRRWLWLPVLLLMLASCKVGMPTITSVRGVRFVTGEKGQLGIEAEIQVNNPNSFGVKIKNLNAAVFMNDAQMGNVTGGKKIRIKALSNDYHTVSLTTDINQLAMSGTNLVQLFTGGKGDFRMKGGGVAKVFIFRKKFAFDHSERLNIQGMSPFGN